MTNMSLRRFGSLAGVVLLILGSIGFTTPTTRQLDSLGPPLVEPQVLTARRGVLELTLEAAPSKITVAGQSFISNVYNGQYTPPVFRLRRGEELQLRLVNKIGPADVQIDETQATNLHYHGMSVSPKPPADDIYLVIPSLEMVENPELAAHAHSQMPMRDNYVYEYRWRVPADHEQGAFWYHSHAHGQAEGQVLSGLSGLFLIDGFIADFYPSLSGAQERFLVLKDIQLPGSDDAAPKSKTVNGQANPTITLARGQPQIWHIGNVGADAFFDLEIEGLSFWVLSRDGNGLDKPDPGDTPLHSARRAIHRVRDVGQGRPLPVAIARGQHRSAGRSEPEHQARHRRRGGGGWRAGRRTGDARSADAGAPRSTVQRGPEHPQDAHHTAARDHVL